ncbi:MAG TPA: thiamine ABC transporter substrate-binding protein [Treponemataceae bacterium]|nr:thiamine ABC transporter substrate-binding protein [Treponemataceae bacterium]
MKKNFSILILLTTLLGVLVASGSKEAVNNQRDFRAQEVVVYTYDSFLTDWGAGPEITRLFEEKTNYTVTFISSGDGAQIMSRAILESDAPQADVLLGIDNNQIDVARENNIMVPYKPTGTEALYSFVILDEEWLMTPYDWSYFTIIYDTLSNLAVPTCLEDLTKPLYEKKIILLDPRTSTPGLGFAAWTVAVFGDKYLDYWTLLKNNILTMAPSWDTGYGLFTSGEAPLVISYITSPAYHVECENSQRYQALLFPQGHIMQIEGAGLVRNALNPEGGKAFIDFLITEEAQNALPLTQWMYPVNKNVSLPPSYAAAPQANKQLFVDNTSLSNAVGQIMNVLTTK